MVQTLKDNFYVDDCLKSVASEEELHNFSDASEKGYGTVIYLRIQNSNGDIHVSLLMGKARVTPLKAITVPRL